MVVPRFTTRDRYRSFQHECKKQFRHAEWNHINSVIQEGLGNKNSKPFWKYVKCKKQDNIGVSPLKQKGNLISDSKGKADNLVEQFQSVFTKVKDSILPDLSNKKIPSMRNIVIESKGVEKLLSNLKHPKQWDQISSLTLFLKLVQVNSRLVLAAYFSITLIPVLYQWIGATQT